MRRLFFLIVGFFSFFLMMAQTPEAYFLSQPCLTPDGQTVIFSFEGDLWKAAIKDGLATRLTAMEGYEGNARVSPDGKWIAFTGTQYGNADVFLMPIDGGEVKQLTYYSGADNVSSWSWDSKYIYFSSNRDGGLSSYKVNILVLLRNMFSGIISFYMTTMYLNIRLPANCSLMILGKALVHSPNAKDIRVLLIPIFNLTIPIHINTSAIRTGFGKDFGATIDRKGNIYFISDESNGEYNLYTFENDKKTALTHFPVSIKNPFVNADGGKVVYEKIISCGCMTWPLKNLPNSIYP